MIEDIRRMFTVPAGITGIGDDCAVIPQRSGDDTLVSTDMLVEGSHFLLDDISAYQLGWKAAAVNFSDIAAMGGSPVGSFLALALPAGLPDGWVESFMEGYRDISAKYAFPLLGGDTTASQDRLCICVTVLGKSLSGRCLKRSGARPGDLVCVTGTLGDSAAGLQAILKHCPRTDEVPYLIERHYFPQPRIEEGLALAQCPGVHAAMDISDGIASDLRHILDASGVGARIVLQDVPMSGMMQSFCAGKGFDAYALAVGGGEDYELLFTVDPEAERGLGVQHTVIGNITQGKGLVWEGSAREYRGFTHF